MSLPRYAEYSESGVDWIGDVPAHWTVAPVKRGFAVIGGSTPKSDEAAFWDGDIVWVSPADLSRLPSIYIADSGRKITEAGLNSCGTTMVPAGSIVLSTRAPIGSLAISTSALCTNQGCKSLVPNDVASSNYFAYVLLSATTPLNLRGKGTTFLELSADELSAFKLPYPSLDEQAAIATFLDRETAKIDALIAEQEKLIALLAEKRQATISHAVTRGLNPHAPMKDSGVPWLGEVPAHWELSSLARIAVDRCDGPFGSGIKSEHYTGSGALVVRLQNIRAGFFSKGEPVFLDQDYFLAELQSHAVVAGDVLVAGLGDENNLLGRACVAPADLGLALVKADCFRFRLDIDRTAPEFIAWQLSAGAAHDAGTLATGTTRSRIPLGTMASRKVALPPLEEQAAIVQFVAQENSRLDTLRVGTDRAIGLLKERRSALIAAAVTGQIDVRGIQLRGAL
jgi:type I restriction enzyme S subunit